jgi:hypothetical protein
VVNNYKFPFLLGAIFCGIRYNLSPNHITDLIEQFHVTKPISVFFDLNIMLMIG